MGLFPKHTNNYFFPWSKTDFDSRDRLLFHFETVVYLSSIMWREILYGNGSFWLKK